MYGLSMNHQLYKRTEVGSETEFFIFAHQCVQHKDLYCRFLLSPLFKHNHERTSLEEENFLIHGGPCCSFPLIFTAYHRERGSGWLRLILWAHCLHSCSNATSSWALESNLNATVKQHFPCLGFSFAHSSKVVHECLLCLFPPVTSANPLLNITWRGDAP